MPAFICVTCGVQHAESDTPPDRCAICDDERQYVNFAGQQWTTLDDMKAKYENYLNEVEPGLTMIGTRPGFGIGQHAFLVHTGNVLWDCCSCIDDATVAAVEALGGVSAIAISHPHFYATCVEWSRALGDVPVFLHADDRDWVMRPDACIVRWDGEVHELADGITIVRGGGHFAGCSMLHWAGGADGKGVVLGSDTIAVGYDRKSAMLGASVTVTLAPCSIDSFIEPFAAGWMPITMQPGRSALTAEAIPEISPPPLMGTSTVKSESSCPVSSRPIVASPAIVSSES